MHKIQVKPIAAESLGLRSFSTIIETPDCRLLMDPSAAVTPLRGKFPHPQEYTEIEKIVNTLQQLSSTVDLVTISHYHNDHHRPTYTNYDNHWSTPESTLKIYQNHPIYAKHPRQKINPAQRRRAYFLEKFTSKFELPLKYMDDSRLQFNNTEVQFSPPFPHGAAGTPLGFIIATRIIYEDTNVVFAPDVQGPVDDQIVHWILSQPPSILILGGPPIYLPNHIFPAHYLESAEKHLRQLHEKIPLILIDHHLLRSRKWDSWRSKILQLDPINHKMQCFAEYLDRPIQTLEADRETLYQRFPPSEEFLKWCSQIKKRRKNPPPLE